jgi:hypothetical protein
MQKEHEDDKQYEGPRKRGMSQSQPSQTGTPQQKKAAGRKGGKANSKKRS